jgi:hypothetical protein
MTTYKRPAFQSRSTTQIKRDLGLAIILGMALFATLCWMYAFRAPQ